MKAGNCRYETADDLPQTHPGLPAGRRAAAAARRAAAQHLRAALPHHDRRRAGRRPRDRHDPAGATRRRAATARPRLCNVGCAGRITSFAETGDGRYLITLTGVCRFRVVEELATSTPFRQCRISVDAFSPTVAAHGENEVDRSSRAQDVSRLSRRRTISTPTGTASAAPRTRR